MHVRFGNGNEKAYAKGRSQQKRQVALGGDGCTRTLPYGHHAELCAVQKDAQPHDDQAAAYKEGNKQCSHGGYGQVQQDAYEHDRQD